MLVDAVTMLYGQTVEEYLF